MESVLNLKSYNKYKNEIDDGLIILPDNNLSDLIFDIKQAYGLFHVDNIMNMKNYFIAIEA